ncbi:MAG TPA: glucuronate isomerase, partial [Sphingomonas sp.]
MARPLRLDPDRLFPADPATRAIARTVYGAVAALPIVSPHGHTDAEWFAGDAPFGDAASLLLAPDHYIYRMLHSQGVPLAALGVPDRSGAPATDPRAAWRVFADH